MSERESEYLEPRVPEFEYADGRSLEESSYYGTGSTKPPRDYASMVAMVLMTIVSLASLLSALSLMNIQLFQEPTVEEPDTAFQVNRGDVDLPAGLEAAQPTVETTEATAPAEKADLQQRLNIQVSQQGAEHLAQDDALPWQTVYETLIPSVVSITCSTGSGTGVVMSADGYIITNAHVIADAQQIRVLLSDDREFAAQCVGYDTVSDLAVLRVQAADLIPAAFGDSGSLRVGDEVMAIGDPLGIELRGTMTDGIISAINRDVKTGGKTMTLIQTTAALNAGNSGGPLVNCYGQVVGINTMKIGDLASVSGVEGLGFAIPSTTVASVVDQLIAYGYVSGRPRLEFSGQMVSTFYQHYYRLPAGFMVTQVEDGSPTAAQGLRIGDIVLYLDEVRITDVEALEEIVFASEVGRAIPAVIYRSGQEYDITITIAEDQSSGMG